MKKFKRTLLALMMGECCLFGLTAGTALAYVDDAGILNGFNPDNTMLMWDYLNQNGYRFYQKSNNEDQYIKKDDSIFISISNGEWSLQ